MEAEPPPVHPEPAGCFQDLTRIQITAHSHEYQKQHLMVVEDFYLHRSWNISEYILFITYNEDLQLPTCYFSSHCVLKESSLSYWVKDNFFIHIENDSK